MLLVSSLGAILSSLKKLSTEKSPATIVLNFYPDIVVIDALFNLVLIGSITRGGASVIPQKTTRVDNANLLTTSNFTNDPPIQTSLLT